MSAVNPLAELKNNTNRPKIYMSSKTHKVVIVFPNGEIVEVANPPERSKDDSSVGSKNGQLSRTGSLTVLRRSTGPNSRKTSVSSPTSSVVSADSDSYASVNLGTEKLPPIDTPEASHVCSIRLRHLLRRIQKDDIPKEDLVRNLEYAASVLETVYIDETRHSQNASNVDSAYTEANSDSSPMQSAEHSPARHYPNAGSRERKRTHVPKRRLCDEDDELSEVEPDAVPSEVRDWLALTFTRSMSNIKRRGEEKPRFRSVAHAIRAGIMVDRIYRRMSSSVGLHVPPNVLLLLKNLDDWSFNVFSVSDAGDGHAIKFVGYELLQKYDLITKFKINTTTLDSFLMHLEQGYSKYQNPYHNLLHGADVAQTVHCVLTQSKMGQWLTDLEVFATLIAALIHDFEHTGTTNNFHIMTGSELALLYNDKAVLENHHISSCFKMFKEEEYNILANLSREEYREFRSLVIDMVLATDMSYHFQQIKNMKNLLSMPENIDKSKALSLVVHCADISHPAKDLALHINWTERLLEEFFRQGDREQAQGLPFSPLCDRKNTLVAESQIGFIEFIVDPSFTVMGDMLEKIMAPLHQQQLQQQQSPRKKDSSISEEVFDSQDKCMSTASSLNSRPPTPRTPTSPGKRYTLKRPWGEHLSANKQYWKERAAKDAQERALQEGHQEQSASAADQSDSGVESPNPAKEEAKGDNTEKVSTEQEKTVDSENQNFDTKDSESATGNAVDIKPLVKGISRQTSTTGLLDKVIHPSPGVCRQTSTTGLLDKLTKAKPVSRTRTSSTQSTDGDEGYFSQITRTSVTSDWTPTVRDDYDNVFEPALTATFSNLRRVSEVDTPSPTFSDALGRGNSTDDDRTSSRLSNTPRGSVEDSGRSSIKQTDV
ncbi:dual specificity calcium/calmodulin-dependent 3',5'-cyclic nucleotide phosphodiesterase 1A-like [Liolophura sinensis]|uniref:dual specificity calcium/calmodulin-dependent 3',5'-cyclic nucleotide phosphodiesterase 1A-like n=1 Tax=Liolophura sinensis TaxID=3198878 RepID=UPI003158C1D6